MRRPSAFVVDPPFIAGRISKLAKGILNFLEVMLRPFAMRLGGGGGGKQEGEEPSAELRAVIEHLILDQSQAQVIIAKHEREDPAFLM